MTEEREREIHRTDVTLDYKNIFFKTLGEKIWPFSQNTSYSKFGSIHWFLRRRQFFRQNGRKLLS
jgi:hypothetical protein